jgi:hypothetical protein
MSYQPSHPTAAPRHLPPTDAAQPDVSVIDDDFDHVLDREFLAIRDSLADFRNV